MITTVISMRDICVILATASIHVYIARSLCMQYINSECIWGLLHACMTICMYTCIHAYNAPDERYNYGTYCYRLAIMGRAWCKLGPQ